MTHPWLRLHPDDKTHLHVTGTYDHQSLCGKVAISRAYARADHFYRVAPGPVCGHCRKTLARLNAALQASEGQ